MKNMVVAKIIDGHEMTVFYSGVGTVTLHLSLSGVKSELFKMVTCLLASCGVMYPGVLMYSGILYSGVPYSGVPLVSRCQPQPSASASECLKFCHLRRIVVAN